MAVPIAVVPGLFVRVAQALRRKPGDRRLQVGDGPGLELDGRERRGRSRCGSVQRSGANLAIGNDPRQCNGTDGWYTSVGAKVALAC